MEADQVRETLRQWISTDDEIRALQNQIKELRDRKNALGGQVLEFMRGNNLDNFVIEGGAGTIARQQRTVRARPGKAVVRAQLAMILADQPQRMVEVLRVLEGVPAGGEDDVNSLTTRELLTRRLPRTQHITLG